MPAALIPKSEVIRRSLEVFREEGFYGASMSKLSDASGLHKASLYNYFPGGKEQIFQAVLLLAAEELRDNVVAVLRSNEDPEVRWEKFLACLSELYSGGEKSCLLNVLSVTVSSEPYRESLLAQLDSLITNVTKLLVDAGYKKQVARPLAEEFIASMQGWLIIARLQGKPERFQQFLHEMKDWPWEE